MSREPKNKRVTLETLADMMQQRFTDIRTDLVAHDQKFDELIEAIHKLPTREEVQRMIDRTYDIAVLKAEQNA